MEYINRLRNIGNVEDLKKESLKPLKTSPADFMRARVKAKDGGDCSIKFLRQNLGKMQKKYPDLVITTE